MKKLCLILKTLAFGAMSLMAQPVITQTPTSQVVASGSTMTLNVTASGAAPAFQWFKDGGLILGATNSLLAVTNAGITNAGVYYVLVTNVSGMVISVPVSVTVSNPSLFGFGYNSDGELGNGTYQNTNTPITIASGVTTMVAGGYHTLFVKTDGTLWTMGLNLYGQLGNGTTTGTNLPIKVASNVVTVAAGLFHSLFIATNGTLWAMGWNQYGQLGNGTYDTTNLPVCIASNVVTMAAGSVHSLFVKTDGTLWAFGGNFGGQLGNGTYNDTNLPVYMASNVVTVAAGYGHSLFVTRDGLLWAVGYNNSGQLGCGTTSNTNRPVSVASNVVAVAAGYTHSLFVTRNGILWAMGNNLNGQLGNGTNNLVNPTPLIVASNVVSVTAGNSHSLFVTAGGTLQTMGYNLYGQLGDGTTNDASIPVHIPSLLVGNINVGSMAYHSLMIGLRITQSNATVTLSNLRQLYTGSAIHVTAVTTPSGLPVNLTYNGSSTAPTNTGSYTVIGAITAPDYFGSSTNALVIGLPPQNFTVSTTNHQLLTLSLTGTPNYPYFLQWTTNLTTPVNWQSIFTNPAGLNGDWIFQITNLIDSPGRFFRTGAQ